MIGSPAELDQAGLAYLTRLTDADLRALVHADQVSAAEADGRIAALRREPALILDVLDRPATSAAVLNLADRRTGARPDRRFALISPFLIFAAAIHRTAADLSASAYAPERTAPRLRIPLFDAGQLSAYLGLPRHRLFLAELLASFAKISSGMVPIPGRPGRRRWSDADPARLAVLLDTVPADQRPPVWRRLGDLALFLAGVFPDAAERVIPGQAAASRLARRTGLDPDAAPDAGAADLLEWLGSGWYWLAAGHARPAAAAVELRERAEQFRPARRVLSTAADRYLLPLNSGWLTAPG